jgi:hypothetical protein
LSNWKGPLPNTNRDVDPTRAEKSFKLRDGFTRTELEVLMYGLESIDHGTTEQLDISDALYIRLQEELNEFPR